MFAISEQPIDPAAWRARIQRPEAGALVVFEGWVRNHHRGRPVGRLDYEAYAEMAQGEGEAMIADVAREFPGVRLACVHRTGHLVPGDIAVWIGATAAHRDDAFRAARLAIEEVKRRLPVWKKEHHPDAEPVWVNCTEDTGGERNAAAYNARQRALPEVGDEGQAVLARASALVVGAGGLGCPAALYLTGAGIGRLTLADGGRVELSNLHRQVLFEVGDVGSPKASRAVLALRARNPHVVIEAVNQDVSSANVRALVAGRSVVLDCTDNFTARLLLHDVCLDLDVPLVQAAVHRWEGVLSVFRRGEGGCLYCAGLPREAAALEGVGNCSGAPVFGPATGVLGTMQAAEALKVLLGRPTPEVGAQHTLLVDLLGSEVTRIARPRHPQCPHCTDAGKATVEAPASDTALWIERDALRPEQRVVLLLTPEECAAHASPTPRATIIHPADTAAVELLAREQGPLVLSCPHGVRSAAVARALRASGLPVQALVGGWPTTNPREGGGA